MPDEVSPPPPPAQQAPEPEPEPEKPQQSGRAIGLVPLPLAMSAKKAPLTDEQLRFICAEIALGRGMLGTFFVRIAESVTFANDRQFRAIRPLLEWIVADNDLAWFLEPIANLAQGRRK
jgi:hypothetical protein